jgi:hypothetical protein
MGFLLVPIGPKKAGKASKNGKIGKKYELITSDLYIPYISKDLVG